MRFAVLLAALLFATSAGAQTRLDEIAAHGALRVGLTGDYRPFSQRDANGSYSGLDVDMATNLAEALGVRLEIIPTTWANLLADLGEGKFDIGMGGIPSRCRGRKWHFFLSQSCVSARPRSPVASTGTGS